MSYRNYQMFDHDMWAVTLSAPCYHPKAASMELAAGLHRFPFTKRRIYSEMMRIYGSVGPQFIRRGNYTTQINIYERILSDWCVSQYNELRMQLLVACSEPDSFIKSLSDDRQRKQAKLVANTLFLLPPAGIHAWNIARAVYYIRCSLLLGKEKQQTAMSQVWEIAKYTQRLYDSWEEYFTAYAVGEQFASENPDARISELRLKELSDLITSDKSAARYFPWDFQLDFSSRSF